MSIADSIRQAAQASKPALALSSMEALIVYAVAQKYIDHPPADWQRTLLLLVAEALDGGKGDTP